MPSTTGFSTKRSVPITPMTAESFGYFATSKESSAPRSKLDGSTGVTLLPIENNLADLAMLRPPKLVDREDQQQHSQAINGMERSRGQREHQQQYGFKIRVHGVFRFRVWFGNSAHTLDREEHPEGIVRYG